MHRPDFAANERRLIEAAVPAIRHFGQEHRDEVFNYFAFDCDAHNGLVLLCLDTLENSVAQAKLHEEYISKKRRKMAYDDPYEIQWAINTIKSPSTGPVLPFNNNTGDFAYQGFAEVSFVDEWCDFVLSDDYPDDFEDSEEDFLESNVAVMFSRAIDQLVEGSAFDELNQSSPFLVGFGLHDGPQLIVRMLNW